MQNWVPNFRFATKTSPLLHPSSSSSIFFNGVFERNREAILWILPSSKARYIPILKPKHQLKKQKCAGNLKVAKKTKKPGAGGAYGRSPLDVRPCAPHHGLTVVSSARSGPVASRTTRFKLLLDLGICLGSSCFGLIGLAFQLSSLSLASTHIFLLKVGPNHANLQS